MAKTKDLFLNIAANPNMTLEDLVSVGLTSENTMLLDRALYASSEKVQNMFKDSEGNFDEKTFNTYYDIAEQSYNLIANDEVNINLLDATAYDVDNIFVDPSRRRKNNAPYIVKLPNPDRLSTSITRIGKTSERTLSLDEIAQTQQVLLNPVAVSKGAKPIWGDAPNDSWFNDFWETRVLASWDEDGTHIDPITGKEVQHKQGDLKLNENGTYYYENLDGRSVYGKRVLNKFNTLTTDGSSWNKYDFFDSDDIEQKSTFGSIAKNLALVGSMFIPYVGWGIAAASIIHQSAGLYATLGKMIAGSDDETLNSIEGWVKSTDRRNLKTEYALQNTWCWENFIDLIGDTTAQLREQRAIFKFAPGIIKGDFKALNKQAMKEYTEKMAKDSMQKATNMSFKDLVKLAKETNPENWELLLNLFMASSKDVFSAKAEKMARDYITNYYKLGEPIAKAYMTAITVLDTFGEAIQAGASDSEATLLTLGYAAAEAALLSTDLGKWIMPELRQDRMRHKMIAKKLLELPKETREMSKQVARLSGETRKSWAKRLFNIGKDIANAEYSTMKKTVGSVVAQGIGEGIEEVSEEALADFSKSCFNLVQQLQGDDVRLNAWNHNWSWSDAANRYGMSLVGGIMGGGINAAASDYKANQDLLNMTSQQAMLQLVYMARNNELDDFWKVINKTELASKELSTKLNDSGTGYKPGTKEDNQDLEAKRALRTQVLIIESIINAENAKLNDSGLLSALIKADPSLRDLDPVKEYRMRALSNSATAGRFLNEWNTITSDIAKNRIEQNKIHSKYGDKSNEKYSEEDLQQLKVLGDALKELQSRKEAMLDGTRTREYVRDAIFEMTHAVNELWNNWGTEIRFVEYKTGKKYSEVSEPERKALKELYEALRNSNLYAEKVHELAGIYESMAYAASDGIKRIVDFYDKTNELVLGNLTKLSDLSEFFQTLLQTAAETGGVETLQQVLDSDLLSVVRRFAEDGDDRILQLFKELDAITDAEIASLNIAAAASGNVVDPKVIDAVKARGRNEKKKIVVQQAVNQLELTYKDVLTSGFVHPENRKFLNSLFQRINSYADLLLDSDFGDSPMGIALFDQLLNIYNLQELADKLPSTPIVQNLEQFQLSLGADTTVGDLLLSIAKSEGEFSSNMESLQLDKVTLDNFTEARNILQMYRAAIVGARFDNVDIDSIVGFNTTLNELTNKDSKIELAEIDATTADMILQDIDVIMKKLDYLLTVHDLNIGNKYNLQNKTALNKQYIIYNKVKHFISIIENDKEWEEGLDDLQAVLGRCTTLEQGTGKTNKDRTFSISPTLKELIEKESIEMWEALHNYLNKHVNGSDTAITKISKILTYDNFKGLIRTNDDFLSSTSDDVDDSAFIWWMCSINALDPRQFYNNYRHIIGLEKEGEKPIAPIPTQELGVFSLTAAIANGEMFKIYGKALRQSLLRTWELAKPEVREQIQREYGDALITEDENKHVFKNNDFLPNFDNVVFVEGIAGSGKTKGVLVTLSKLLANANPDFMSSKVIFAHTDTDKASDLASSTLFTNYDTKDHDSLLKFMSSDYVNRKSDDGVYKYVLDRDVKIVDGMFRSTWELLKYDPVSIPRVIFIDEWSHYNLLELELIQRFCLKYGTTVVAMGDYDQLTPRAKIYKTELDEKAWMEITPNRNMMPRVVKLGVSMRTDNEVKNKNIYNMLAWKLNPTSVVNLHYYQDDRGIFGDKVYNAASSYGSELELIKMDVKQMIATLKDPNEKIGYIYHRTESELYKWLTTTEGIKEHILAYSETDAHGREAQYYIVENNRSEAQNALDYFRSTYTGMTRSELGSLIISSFGYIHTNLAGKHNETGISLKSKLDTSMLHSTFTDEGTRDFSRKRKNVFDKIFGDEAIVPFNISAKTTEDIKLVKDLDGPRSTTLEDDFDDAPPPADEPGLEPPIPTETGWLGNLAKNQKLYNRAGIAKYCIIDENNSDAANPTYIVNDMESGETVEISKADAESNYFLNTFNRKRHFNIGDLIVYKKDELCVIEDIYLSGDITKPQLIYKFKGMEVTHDELTKMLKKGEVTTYTEMSEDLDVTPPVTVFETEGITEYQEAVDELFETSEEELLPEVDETDDGDIDLRLLGFTFNTQYFADEFDLATNQIVVKQRDAYRIDNGYGLNKINPVKWSSKLQIEKDLGSLRQHLEFSSNADILKQLGILLRLKNLSLRWGFISKAATDSSGRYARFNPPTGYLENMSKDDLLVPLKTISAIVYDSKHIPILEIPMVTLQSPHSILRAMKKKNIAPDITSLWNFGLKQPGLEKALLENIIATIKKNHSGKPGFEYLASICKLWLFTTNGVKLLPQGWNLHRDTRNIGNIYVTQRISDSVEEHNYSGDWVDLTSIQRKDRFISNIMMNNRFDRATNPLTGNAIEVFREYVPYVFISDDPTITSDKEAASRYLQQLVDSLLEKTVKVIPVVPPEISVSDYIRTVTRVVKEGYNDAPYGNHFTAYRIFDAILKSPNANVILSPLDESTRQFVKDCVSKLNEIKETNPIYEDETKLEYKQRIALLRNKLLRETFSEAVGDSGSMASRLLGALVDCYAYTLFGTDNFGDEGILKMILEACDNTTGSEHITGVLCKPKFKRDLKGKGICGFAYNVIVDDVNNPQGKYLYPGHGSFRIFGKIDTPTYDLSSLLPHIDYWAKNAVEGRTVVDRDTGKTTMLENIWSFVNDDAKDYYLPQPQNRKINLENVRKNYRSLLAKLNIDELYIDTSELDNCKSEAEALQKVTELINQIYLKTNGAFIIRDSKGNFKYGNIVSDRTPEFKNYKFDSLQTSQEGYKLRFINLDTNSIEEIDMTLDPSTNSFSIIPLVKAETPAFNVSEQLPVILESIKKSLSYKNADDNKKAVFDQIFACYDVNTNTVNIAAINQLLKDNFSMLSIPTVVKNLKLKEIEGSAIDENVCVNPIKIKFK